MPKPMPSKEAYTMAYIACDTWITTEAMALTSRQRENLYKFVARGIEEYATIKTEEKTNAKD